MAGHLELEIGAQARAAAAVHERIPKMAEILESLSGEVEAAASGFRGAAATGLAEALQAWFAAASAIPERLAGYAASLVEVDQRTAAAEETASQSYAGLVTRMGGLIR